VLTGETTRPTPVSDMLNQRKTTTSKKQEPQVPASKHSNIKLGLDVHADTIVVVRIIENTGPQPAQTFKPDKFLAWAKTQLAIAEEVHSCYEAGPFGFVLHRQLEALGIRNLVVQPVCLDEHKTGVNHDKSDARELAQRLDRWVAGNPKALATVRVPTPEEEQRRTQTRQREQLKRELKRLGAQGRSLLLTQGYREKGKWWTKIRWEALQASLPTWLIASLDVFRKALECFNELLGQLDLELRAKSTTPRPVAMGGLTSEVVDREVGDWNRFNNRRQVGSYTGLCGGISSSGQSHRQLSITKHGNVRLRTALVEMAWRMVRYQPNCPLIKKWKPVLSNVRATKGAKKKAIVAIARQLAVDIWRWRTGRITPDQLGWEMV